MISFDRVQRPMHYAQLPLPYDSSIIIPASGIFLQRNSKLFVKSSVSYCRVRIQSFDKYSRNGGNVPNDFALFTRLLLDFLFNFEIGFIGI